MSSNLPVHLKHFLSQFIAFYVSIIQNAAGTTAQAISSYLSFIIHSTFSQHFWFSPLFSTLKLPNLQLQLHNCHFTTANYILQLQKLSSVAR